MLLINKLKKLRPTFIKLEIGKMNFQVNLEEKILLRKRNIIETVFDYLKNKMDLEHTRHRSPINAFVHILSTLVAYSLKKSKPSINWSFNDDIHISLIPN